MYETSVVQTTSYTVSLPETELAFAERRLFDGKPLALFFVVPSAELQCSCILLYKLVFTS